MLKLLLNLFRKLKSESIQLRGDVKYVLRGPDGKVKDIRFVSNLIVNGGFDLICDAVSKSASRPAAAEYIAIGTSATAAAATQTALLAEAARGLATYAHTVGTKVYTLVYTFAAGTGTGAITESGILNAASVGTLLNRQTFAVINKGALDSLQVTWTITLT
jgi:hypothetical protein